MPISDHIDAAMAALIRRGLQPGSIQLNRNCADAWAQEMSITPEELVSREWKACSVSIHEDGVNGVNGSRSGPADGRVMADFEAFRCDP